MSFTVLLSKYIVLDIAKYWLSLKEICALDTAIAEQKCRLKYLSYLSEVCFKNCTSSLKELCFLKWLNIRYIKVDSFVFSNAVLQGIVEMHLPLLSMVKSVRFSHCWKGNIQSAIKALSVCNDLTELSLSDSKHISDAVILSVSEHCPKLTTLDFQSLPKITDKSIISLTEQCLLVNCINLSHCRSLTDSAIVAMTHKYGEQLTSLNISCLQNITDISIMSIATHCQQLMELDIRYCLALSEEGFISFISNSNSNLNSNLTTLLLSGCIYAVTDTSLTLLSTSFTRLTKLHINDCIMATTDVGVTAICEGCRLLTDLNISDLVDITNISILAILNNLHFIRRIECWNNNLNGAKVLVLLSHMFKSITHIDVSSCRIAGVPYDKHFSTVNNSSSNSSNGNSSNSSSSPRTVQRQINRVYNVVNTFLTEDDEETYNSNNCLQALSTKCTSQLVELTIDVSAKKDTIQSLLTVCGVSLLKIVFDYCDTTIDDSILTHLSQYCTQLTELSLVNCKLITCKGIRNVVQHNKGLVRLSVQECTLIKDIGIVSIADSCKQLTYLNIGGCLYITDESVLCIAKYCHRLHTLIMFYCLNITSTAIDCILRECTCIHTIDINHTDTTNQYRNDLDRIMDTSCLSSV